MPRNMENRRTYLTWRDMRRRCNCGRTGDAYTDFEEQAAAFYRETGFVRPGKDVPAAFGGEDDHGIRQMKFKIWVEIKIHAARAALARAQGAGS